MLTLDYKKMVNWQDTVLVRDPESGKRVENPWNFAMGLFMIHTGINNLTRENAAEFYMRAKLIEVCFGNLYTQGDGTPRYLTTDDVARYIGLTSNVSTYTSQEFFGHLRTDVIANLRQAMKDALREHDKLGVTT